VRETCARDSHTLHPTCPNFPISQSQLPRRYLLSPPTITAQLHLNLFHPSRLAYLSFPHMKSPDSPCTSAYPEPNRLALPRRRSPLPRQAVPPSLLMKPVVRGVSSRQHQRPNWRGPHDVSRYEKASTYQPNKPHVRPQTPPITPARGLLPSRPLHPLNPARGIPFPVPFLPTTR
jgi:hypothetical protein